ncbi:MAG TPA: tetratricopeptide repeat protein [Puia sp.]|jgi:Tfp pilus assembly protein PilF
MEKIEKLKSFLINSPGDSFLKHALALEYIKLGEEAKARQLFLEILEYDPSYIGSYYHLARLLERTGESENAKTWYEKGMAAAKKAGDIHAYNELSAAYEDFID